MSGQLNAAGGFTPVVIEQESAPDALQGKKFWHPCRESIHYALAVRPTA